MNSPSPSNLNEKPRLLVLASTFPRFAGDREPPFVFELCRRLTDTFAITVLAPHAPGVAREETREGLRVLRYRYAWPESWQTLAYQGGILPNLRQNRWRYLLLPGFLAAQWWAIWRLTRRERFDLIHAHWLIPQGALALSAVQGNGSNLPVVCTSHGGDLFGLRGKLARRVKAWVLGQGRGLTTVSEAMRDEAIHLGANREKVEVIPMGVDLTHRFTPEPARERDWDLLFVGRLVEKKGVDLLIAAMPEILRQFPSARLTIIGGGPEQSALEHQAQSLGVAPVVLFLGPQPNETLAEHYRRAKVVVFPSRVAAGGDREGFGLVLVEALGCGCAVVASDLAAMRDIVRHGETAWITPAEDVSALAEGIVRLLADPDLRQRLAREGNAFVRARFDWAIIARDYAAWLQRFP